MLYAQTPLFYNLYYKNVLVVAYVTGVKNAVHCLIDVAGMRASRMRHPNSIGYLAWPHVIPHSVRDSLTTNGC